MIVHHELDVWRLMVPTTDPGTEADRMPDEAVLAEVTRQLGERTGCDPSLVRDPEWVTSFRVHRRLAETYRDGRILLTGDAAHVHSPFGGQGMNTGIGDAENLARKLATVVNATAEHELLDGYEGEWRPIARMMRGEYAAVVAKRHGEIMLVRPDAHLGWRGRADPELSTDG